MYIGIPFYTLEYRQQLKGCFKGNDYADVGT